MELLEFGFAIVFSVGNANGRGADVKVAMLVVTAMWWGGIEIELDVN